MTTRTIQGSIEKNIAYGAEAGSVAGKVMVPLMMLATILGVCRQKHACCSGHVIWHQHG